MLEKIITWSLDHRALVLVLSLVLVISGIQALAVLPIDAFPDTTPVQVQINTVAPALAPLEIEQQITFPVERVVSGIPGLEEVRSISKFGFSQVTAIFEEGTDIYFARQLVGERLQTADLPVGISRPEMGPVATGLGEIFHYLVSGDDFTLEELTTIHDWVIKPRLESVPGVAEVNTWGGEKKQFHVNINPDRLIEYAFTFDDVFRSLQKNNLSVGGGNITQAGELFVVRGVSLTTRVEEIENIVVSAFEGQPIRIKDLGEVVIGHETRLGAATSSGQGEVVLGLAFMLMGENSHEVSDRLSRRMEEIRPSLPEGVKVNLVYVRTELVDRVLETVRENLLAGALLVVSVLFIFLGNLRAGLIVALAIPLSMLFAFNAMLRFGVAASLMSLGAIDLGLIVDSSVIMVENSVRHLSQSVGHQTAVDTVRAAAIEVRRPTMFGELIIMIVYLPILTLEGIEGDLFRPMALTVVFALLGSLILSITLMPVLASIFLPRRKNTRDNLIVRAASRCYRPLVRLSISARYPVALGSVVLLMGALWLGRGLGSEFIPRLSEMSVVINTVRLSGVSLEESVRYGTRLEQLLQAEFPDEIRDIWTRTGTAEVATDPMGIELSDIFMTLKPREQWTKAKTQDELVQAMSDALAGLPGMRMVFTQPIEMRVNEMIAGIRTDVGIKIFGDDFDVLKDYAAQIDTSFLRSVEGSTDIYTEQITGLPILEVKVDQSAIARYGVTAAHVLEAVEAIGGITVGEIREQQRRFDLVVRLDEEHRRDPLGIERILIPTASGERVPIGRLASIGRREGPSTISREWQKRRILVQCNVRGRDMGGFVAELREKIKSGLSLPSGYYIELGGQFEHLERARRRLMIIVPMALILVLFLLYMSTESLRDALIIFTGAPFAALGGIAALWIRDMPFTISAGVGFVAVSGIAMFNGLVMVSTIKQLLATGSPLREAIEQSALVRLRPVLMTALVASLGFVPMAFNTGVGAEVQRPLATVVVGGVISDGVLTLLVLPALYAIFGRGGVENQ